MTKLVLITKTGPRFQEPRSLEQQLEASVAYELEKWLQSNCVSGSDLPDDDALNEVHHQLDWVVGKAVGGG